ncbi:MAG: alanine--tRNA ligase-related protein, partial [Raoultibacter sp.]
LSAGESGEIICDKTPFYAEKGGQVGDEGVLRADGISVKVTDTQEPEKGLIAHTVIVEAGMVEPGMTLQAEIDIPRRERIRRNHTATHVLHWALRQVLGDHVKQ